MGKLDGRVAIVTGAGQGIGAEVADAVVASVERLLARDDLGPARAWVEDIAAELSRGRSTGR